MRRRYIFRLPELTLKGFYPAGSVEMTQPDGTLEHSERMAEN